MAFMAALLCLAVLDFGSSGVVRQGGDDEGSGIGGTGRLQLPGSESGLGGTGLKPFLGINATGNPDEHPVTEIEVLYSPLERERAVARTLEIDVPPVRDIELAPVPAPVQVASAMEFTRDSSAISITEQIQRDIEANALAYVQVQDYAAAQSADRNPLANDSVRQSARSTESPEQSSRQEDLAWQAVAKFFSQNQDAERIDTTDSVDSADRVERPERVQRPELPAMQRVSRPVQRAGILPPRVKPLRL